MILLKNNALKKYYFNTIYLLFEKGARLLLTLFVWGQVIRYLGPEQFGIFSYALSLVFLFSMLAYLGLNDVVVKSIVERKEDENRVLGSVFLLKFLGGMVAITGLWISVKLLGMHSLTKALILILSVQFVFKSLENIEYYFQANVLSKYIVYSRLFGYMITAFLCFIFIYSRKTVIFFAVVVTIEIAVIGLALMSYYQWLHHSVLAWRCHFQLMRKFLKDSWPIIISGLAISVYMRIDQIMIKEILGAYEVGLYSAAVRISEVFYFIPIVIADSFFPAIVSAKMRSENLYKNRLRALMGLHLWIAIGFAIMFNLISVPLVKGLFGPAYLTSASVLSLHVWAGLFVSLGVVVHKWCIIENLQKFHMVYTILGAIMNVFLNFIFIPRFSVWGAALATVISYFIAAMLGFAFHSKTRKIFFLELESFNIFQLLKLFRDRSLIQSI